MHPPPHVPDLPQVEARSFFAYTPNEVKHRKRTTPDQLQVLEAVFSTETKPCLAKRKDLAEQLGMNMRGVQVWFQNRRAKQKNQTKKTTHSPHPNSDDDNDSSASPRDPLPSDSHSSSAETEKVENTPSSSPPVPRTSPRQIVMDLSASMEPPADLLSLRRGSLPANMLPHSQLPISPDAVLGRRQSIDSMGKLGTHPYAMATRNRNSLLCPRPSLGGGGSVRPPHLRAARSLYPPSALSSTFTFAQPRSLAHRASMPHVHAHSRPGMQSPVPPHAIASQRRGSDNLAMGVGTGMGMGDRTMSLPAGPLPTEGFSFGTPASPDGSYASSESGVAPGDASHGTSTPENKYYSGLQQTMDIDALQRWNFPGVPHQPVRRESELSSDDADDAASVVPLSRFGSIASVSSGTSGSGGGFTSDCGFESAVSADMRRRSSCISDMQIHMASLNVRSSIPGGKLPYDGHSAAAAAACAAVRRDRGFTPSTTYGSRHDGFAMNGSQQHAFSASDCAGGPSLQFHNQRHDSLGLDKLHSTGSSVSSHTISSHGPMSPNDAKGYQFGEHNMSRSNSLPQAHTPDTSGCLTGAMYMHPHSFHHAAAGISPLDESCGAAVSGLNVNYHFPGPSSGVSTVPGPHVALPYDGGFAPDAAGPPVHGVGMQGRGSFSSGPSVGAEFVSPSEAGLGGHGDAHSHSHSHSHSHLHSQAHGFCASLS